MTKNKIGQLDDVHAAIMLGCDSIAEISDLTGLPRKRVTDLRWHLDKSDNDLEKARKHRSAVSMKSKSKRTSTNVQQGSVPLMLKTIETNGYKARPHMILGAVSRSCEPNMPNLAKSEFYEEIGRGAFYLSDRALEARTFS